MMTKEGAIQTAAFDWAVNKLLGSYDEDFLESLGNGQVMTDHVMADLKAQWEELKADFIRNWGEPEETPCGWVFYTQVVRVGGAIWFLVDLWTEEIVYDLDIYSNHPSERLATEAALRVYINRLPEPRRSEAQERMHLLPYTPVRFYPPYLEFSTGEYEESDPREFEVLLDPTFFAKKQLPLPDVVLMEMIVRWMSLEAMRENPDWLSDWKEVPEAMYRISRSEEGDLIRDKYRLVIPAFDELSQSYRIERAVKVCLKFRGISPAQEDTVKVQYLDWNIVPLAFDR